MVDKELARTVIGIMGNILSFCLFGSPIPTFAKILKSKSVGDFKRDPYLSTLMNCFLWDFYGLPMVHPETLLITINSIGLAMSALYITIFLIYAETKARVKVIGWIFIQLVFMVILVTCTLKFIHTNEQRSTIVGIICLIFNVLMYASPLTIMIEVIKTKSVKYMPFCLSLSIFFNGIMWVLYAVIDKLDLFILIANGVGLLSGAIQLTFHACYYKVTLKDEDDDKPVKELQPSAADAKA